MTYLDFVLRLHDLKKDVKILCLEKGDRLSEVEVRLFVLPYVKETVESAFRAYADFISNSTNAYRTMRIDGYEVTDIVYHDAHFKKDRYYEIVIE